MEIVGNSVRVGIEAPRSLPVYREEIWEAVKGGEPRRRAGVPGQRSHARHTAPPSAPRHIARPFTEAPARGSRCFRGPSTGTVQCDRFAPVGAHTVHGQPHEVPVARRHRRRRRHRRLPQARPRSGPAPLADPRARVTPAAARAVELRRPRPTGQHGDAGARTRAAGASGRPRRGRPRSTQRPPRPPNIGGAPTEYVGPARASPPPRRGARWPRPARASPRARSRRRPRCSRTRSCATRARPAPSSRSRRRSNSSTMRSVARSPSRSSARSPRSRPTPRRRPPSRRRPVTDQPTVPDQRARRGSRPAEPGGRAAARPTRSPRQPTPSDDKDTGRKTRSGRSVES